MTQAGSVPGGLQGFQNCETAIALPKQAIADFCIRWKIDEFYLFGSILRTDFRAESDVDTMVQFAPEAQVGLFELAAMKRELEETFSRRVDLITKKSIKNSDNWIRRKEILGTARLLYAAG